MAAGVFQESWRTRFTRIAREMDWSRGLRAAVALCVPIVLGDVLSLANFGWAGLGGYEAVVADPGGPYRLRLRSLATLTFGGGVGVFLGALAGNTLHWALPLTLVWCFCWSYVAVLGQPFTTAGLLVQVVYICGLGAPASTWREALTPAVFLAGGGLWAMALSLFVWPFDAYRPARTAVSHCYSELASFLRSVLELSQRPEQTSSLWHRLAQHHQYRVRRDVEAAWNSVAHVRSEQMAGGAQEQQLVVLLETADMLIARTVALAEHLEACSRTGLSACDASGMAALQQLEESEEWIAGALVRRRELPSAMTARQQVLHELPFELQACMRRANSYTQFLLNQVKQVATLLETAVESAGLLRSGGARTQVSAIAGQSAGYFGYVYARMSELPQGWDLHLLRANLTRDSLTLRHAGRVSLVCGLDLTIMLLGHINHGYWLLLTSLIVLQPHVGGTVRRGMQRIGGTIAGGVLAAVLAMKFHSQGAIAAVLFPFSLLSLAILPVSYAAFAFFLTPTFVLAWLPFAGDWQLAILRIANTFFGALIAMAAMLFLFPAYERERAPRFLKASLEANRRYLEELALAWRNGSRSSRTLANARRGTGLAHNQSEELLDRVLAEDWAGKLKAGQYATGFVTYLRRFAQSITTLTALEGEEEWKQSTRVQSSLAVLRGRLQWLIDSVEHSDAAEEAAEWPEWLGILKEERGAESGERQLERLERQSDVLRRQLLGLHEHGWLAVPGGDRRS